MPDPFTPKPPKLRKASAAVTPRRCSSDGNHICSFDECLVALQRAHSYELEKLCADLNGKTSGIEINNSFSLPEFTNTSNHDEICGKHNGLEATAVQSNSFTNQVSNSTPRNHARVDMPTMAYSSENSESAKLNLPWVQAAVVEKWGDIVWRFAEQHEEEVKLSVPHPVWSVSPIVHHASWDNYIRVSGSISSTTMNGQRSWRPTDSSGLARSSQNSGLSDIAAVARYAPGGLQYSSEGLDDRGPAASASASAAAAAAAAFARRGRHRRLNDHLTKLVLHPTCKRRLAWDVFGALACSYEIAMLPLLFASLIDENSDTAVIMCVYWTLDILMNCFTGFFRDSDGFVERDHMTVMTRYVKTWLFADLLIVGVDFFVIAAGGVFGGELVRVLKSFSRFVRIVRLFRLLRLAPRLQAQLGYITSQYVFSGCRLVSYMLLVMMMNHYVACMWCACWSAEHTDSLFDGYGNADTFRYVTALHWCLAHSFLGSMDIFPTSMGERVMTCLVLALSFAIFSVLLSIITNDALELRRTSAESAKRYSRLMTFFNDQRLSSELVCRVLHFCKTHKAFDIDCESDGLDMSPLSILPDHVRREITHELFWKILREHPFFRAYGAEEQSAVRILCQEGVSVTMVFPNERLVWFDNSAITSMIFVKRGTLHYFEHDHEDARLTLSLGMWACEEALWSECASLPGWFLAGQPDVCELLMISPECVRDVARLHQNTMAKVRNYACKFVAEFNSCCSDFAFDQVLFNDENTLERLVSESGLTVQHKMRSPWLRSRRTHSI